MRPQYEPPPRRGHAPGTGGGMSDPSEEGARDGDGDGPATAAQSREAARRLRAQAGQAEPERSEENDGSEPAA